ncbi:hypothetical protein CCH79_00020500, partial [Gambusia affinis]
MARAFAHSVSVSACRFASLPSVFVSTSVNCWTHTKGCAAGETRLVGAFPLARRFTCQSVRQTRLRWLTSSSGREPVSRRQPQNNVFEEEEGPATSQREKSARHLSKFVSDIRHNITPVAMATCPFPELTDEDRLQEAEDSGTPRQSELLRRCLILVYWRAVAEFLQLNALWRVESEICGRGQDSLIANAWPLAFLRSRSTTAACGCLATSCRDLRGYPDVDFRVSFFQQDFLSHSHSVWSPRLDWIPNVKKALEIEQEQELVTVTGNGGIEDPVLSAFHWFFRARRFPFVFPLSAVTIRDDAHRPRVILTAGTTTIPVGGSVALSCSVEPSAGWEYRWFRWTPETLRVQVKNDGGLNRIINVTQGGFYQCKVSNKVVVIRRPNWPQMFSGESITLTCEVQGGETTEWTCDWRIDGSFIHRTDSKDWTFSVSESNRGDYRCLCFPKDDWFSSTEWSEPISLSVLRKPKAHLSTDSTELPAGGNVILTCSLNTSPSSPFSLKYFWYRGEKSSEPVSSEDADFPSNGQMSVSEEGLYWCRGGRGEPVYYTDYSDHVNITKNCELNVFSFYSLLFTLNFKICFNIRWVQRSSRLFVVRAAACRSPWWNQSNYPAAVVLAQQTNERLNPSQSSNQTVNHEVNQSELNASHPEGSPDPLEGALWSYVKTQAIELPVDPEEGAVYANVKKGATDESIDTVYSLIEMKTFGTMKDPHDPQEGAVGSDVKT